MTITIQNIRAFRKWQKLKAKQNAIKRRLSELAATAGLPISSQFEANTIGTLLTKTGKVVGKFTVYDVPEKVVSGFRACRIS